MKETQIIVPSFKFDFQFYNHSFCVNENIGFTSVIDYILIFRLGLYHIAVFSQSLVVLYFTWELLCFQCLKIITYFTFCLCKGQGSKIPRSLVIPYLSFIFHNWHNFLKH